MDIIFNSQETKGMQEEEKRQRILESKRKYAKKRWVCELCETDIRIDHKSRHLNSIKHKTNLIL